MKVSCRKDGPVWRIGLLPGPRGSVLIDPEGVRALVAVLEESAADPACRVLILEGSGERFCEGLDLEAVLELGAEEQTVAVRAFAGCLSRLRQARQLVVALVDGPAAGGGLGLAAAADLLLATARASFQLPELVLGLLPAVVMPILLERLPPQRARWLALSERVDAEQALTLGLVDRVVRDGAELERALRGTLKHALRLHPGAVGELKRLVTEQAPLSLDAALERGAACTAAILADPARTSPLRAFLEGAALPWFDRQRGRQS